MRKWGNEKQRAEAMAQLFSWLYPDEQRRLLDFLSVAIFADITTSGKAPQGSTGTTSKGGR